MRHTLRCSLAALFMLAAILPSRGQSSGGESQPAIVSIRGKVITVQVPEGFDSVTLQALRRPPVATRAIPAPRPVWRTVDTQFPQGAATTLTFRIGKLLPARSLRVFGTRGAPLPASYFAGPSRFAADPNGPMSGEVSTLWRNGKVSIDSTSGTFEAGGAGPAREVVEADIWKIRGERLLYFNQLRGLQVFDLHNPAEPALLGTLRVPASGEDLYVLDDKYAVLLKRSAGWWDGWWFGGGWGGIGVGPVVLSATTDVTISSTLTSADSLRHDELIVATYDAGTPAIAATLPLDGALLESRLVGSVLYVATSVTRELPDDAGWESGTQLQSFDLSDPAHPVERAKLFLPGYADVVSATDRFFLITSYRWESDASSVDIIDISSPDGAIGRRGAVNVEGYIPDKFKLSVDGEILRVVSESWIEPGGDDGGVIGRNEPVTVLQTFSIAQVENPTPLGRLAIAPGEWVRATRFDGSRAYVVTFEQVDPLHIVDLRDPAHPVISGTVSVPGFSTYIEPLGDRLVTIGLVNWRPTVSLFDVSDATEPRLLSQVKLGTPDSGWAESEAVWNEKAFKVIPEENLILLPIAGYDYSGKDSWEGSWFSRVQLIDLLPDRLTKRGVIEANFSPRRADLYHGQILAVSPTRLVSVDAADRDAPIVTAAVEIARRIDRVWLVGDFLVQLGGDAGWPGDGIPKVTVSPRLEPERTLTVVNLPQLDVAGTALRDGVLYVAQRSWTGWWSGQEEPSADEQRLLLSAYDVSALPQVKLLSKSSAAVPVTSWSQLTALWPSPGTLVWAAEDRWRSWYRLEPGTIHPQLDAAAHLAPANGGFSIARGEPWLGGWTNKFIAFDVSTPEKIAFASVVDFANQPRGIFSKPFAADGLIYFSIYSPGEGWIDDHGRSATGRIGNEHALTVIEYHDPRAPFLRDERVQLPGELRAVGANGKLLYTVGPDNDSAANLPSAEDLRSVQVSAFDGLAAHLVDHRPVHGTNVSLELHGDDLFVLDEQPAYIWEDGPIIPVDSITLPYRFEPTPNPQKSQLQRLRLLEGAFATLAEKSVDHDAGLFVFGDLLATQTEDHGVRLLDLSSPAEITQLKNVSFTAQLFPLLDGADGTLGDRLYVPFGDYGLEAIDLRAH